MRTFVALFLVAALSDCSCQHAASNGDGGLPFDLGLNSLYLEPFDVTLDLTTGQPPPTQAFTALFHTKAGDKNVTTATTF